MFQNNKIPPLIIIYGSSNYLGAHLAAKWREQKIPLTELNEETASLKSLLRSPFRVIFIAGSSVNQLEEVAVFRELLTLPSQLLIKFTLISHLAANETNAFLEKTLAEKLPTGKWQIIKLPIVFGPGAPLKTLGILGSYLKNLHHQEPLQVPSEGLKKTPLLFINDALKIVELIVDKRPEAVLPVIPSEILTELELAYLLRSLSPQKLPVVFGPTTELVNKNSDAYPPTTISEILPSTPLREALRTVVNDLSQPLPTVTEIAPVQNRETNTRQQKSKTLSFSAIGILLALIISSGLLFWCPLTATAFFGLVGKNQLEDSITKFKNMDLVGAKVSAAAAADSLENGLQNSQKLPSLPFFKQAEQFLRGGKYVAEGITALTEAATIYLSASPSEADVIANSPKIREAYNSLTLASLEIPKSTYLDTSLLDKLLPSLKVISSLSPALPKLLGFDRPKTYLVLLQNPMELRPTGGFIGSYAKVVVNKGKISEVLLDDIYNPDGQLEQKDLGGPLPPEMAIAMPSLKKLYIRDANWWISYPESANTIANLYKLATRTAVDGVMALDLYMVRDLLEVAGPIYLGSYDKTINAGNLYEQMQASAESNYFNGSSQKKNFLQLLGNKLLEKLGTLGGAQKLVVLELLNKNLSEKHLLLSSVDANVAPIFSENNWDGALPTSATSDILMVVDTNIGGNKANYTVQRTVDYEVNNSDRAGTLTSALTVNYQNTAAANSWPTGIYQNYLRIVVPQGALLKTASMTQLPPEAEPNKGLVKTGEYAGFTIFSFGFSLNPQQSLNLKLEYTLPKNLNLTATNRAYALKVLKQPGTAGDPFSFMLSTPFGRTLGLPTGFKAEASGISLDTSLQTDLDLQIPIN